MSSVRRPSKKAGFIYSQLMDLDHRTNRRKKKKTNTHICDFDDFEGLGMAASMEADTAKRQREDAPGG